jgi:hypothetical protein
LVELRGELDIASVSGVAEVLDGLAPEQMACVMSSWTCVG